MPYTIVMSFYGQGHALELIEDAVKSAGMAWWLMELPSGAIFFSPEKTRMLGYDDPSTFVHYNDFVRLVHDDDKDQIMQAMTDHLEGRALYYETSYRILCADGSYKVFYDRGRISARKGNEVAVTGIVVDATYMQSIQKIAKKKAQVEKSDSPGVNTPRPVSKRKRAA